MMKMRYIIGIVTGIIIFGIFFCYLGFFNKFLDKKSENNQNINSQNEVKSLNNCLTETSFNRVFEKLKTRHSLTAVKYNNKKWQVNTLVDEDGKTKGIVFKQNGYSIGKITSNLKIYSFIKDIKSHKKSKIEINEIFCKLNKWTKGDTSIGIDQ